MNKGVLLVVAVLAVAVLVGGGVWIFSHKDEDAMAPVVNTEDTPMVVETLPATTPATETEAMVQGSIKKFTIEGSNFKFSPTSIKVNKGDTVQITFKNSGGDHSFAIDEFDVKTNTISDGEEEEVEFVANKVGVYEYYCSEETHSAKGMVGKLIVE